MLVDYHTGEISDIEEYRKEVGKREKREYVQPIDISKFTSRLAVQMYKNQYYEKRCPKLECIDLPLLMDGTLNNSEVKLIFHLSDSLIFHTYGVVNRERICAKLGWGENMYRRILRGLGEKNIVKMMDVKMENKKDKLFRLHPFYGFVGTHPMRDRDLNSWIIN